MKKTIWNIFVLLLTLIGGKAIAQDVPTYEVPTLDCPVFEHRGWFDLENRDGKVTFYDPDGSLLAEGTFLNGQPEGSWIFYHPNGKRKSSGNLGKTTAESLLEEEDPFLENGRSGEKEIGFSAEESELVQDTIQWDFPPDQSFEEFGDEAFDYVEVGILNICLRFPGRGKIGLWKYYDTDGNLIYQEQYLD